MFILALTSHQKHYFYDSSLKDTDFFQDKSSKVLSQMRPLSSDDGLPGCVLLYIIYYILYIIPLLLYFPFLQAALVFQFWPYKPQASGIACHICLPLTHCSSSAFPKHPSVSAKDPWYFCLSSMFCMPSAGIPEQPLRLSH